MSTKNLARTAIEGGRYFDATSLCRYRNGATRARARMALARLPADADDWTIVPAPRVGRQFRDKLRPPERWLDAQVGRPWNLVHGELLRKFDTRTTAGRHIVFDHMLSWVQGKGRFPWLAQFSVDRHGLLRRLPRRYLRAEIRPPLPRPERELAAWLSGRRVGARGDLLFWFAPTATGAYRQHHRLGEDDGTLWLSLPAWFRACHDLSAPPKPVT